MIIWNSHAFNLTDQDGKLEAWMNLYFAPPEEQLYPQRGIPLDVDALFKMDVPAFHAEEVCGVFTLPKRSNLFELSSHMHQRGKRLRTSKVPGTAAAGPTTASACSPFGPDAAFQTTDLCAGAPCESTRCRPKPATAMAT